MYQALYRKYRPAVFSDVVGQSHITRTLQKQVAENRASHAYLFTGSRGTGKTTCAKILSRAVNCENPKDGNPCGTCAACVALEEGNSLDVLELDAASNNGVDQVRALRDEAIYPPANVRKRVYIVDEVHMLSTSAFNALLKILEEPPEHLIFILATTELHKVPATILSRCQRYAFRRIQPRDIAARLKDVAEREKIPLTDDGAELLARLAEGAMRDGLSLLDQCAASGGTVDAAAVLDTLGLAGNLQTAQLLEHILNRDVPSALALFGELYDNGRDGQTVLRELAALIRDLLLKRMAPDGSASLLSGGYDDHTLARLESLSTDSRLLYLATALQGVGAEFSDAANSRLNTELRLLRLCDETLSGDLSALVSRVERLESGFSGAQPPHIVGQPQGVRPLAQPAPRRVAQPSATTAQAAAPFAQISAPERVPQPSAPLEPPPPLDDMPPFDAAPPPDYAPPFDGPSPQYDTPPNDDAPSDNPTQDSALFDNLTVQEDNAAFSEPDAPSPEMAEPVASVAPFDWDALLKRCKKRLNWRYLSLKEYCGGIMESGRLIIFAQDSVISAMLDKEDVKDIFRSESGAESVIIREATPEDNRKKLLEDSREWSGVSRIIGEESTSRENDK